MFFKYIYINIEKSLLESKLFNLECIEGEKPRAIYNLEHL